MQRAVTENLAVPAASQESSRPDRATKTEHQILNHERRILGMAIMAGLPGTALALILLWTGSYSTKVQWTATIVVVIFWFGFAFSVRDRVVYPLQTLSNLLAGLREGDFSLRARGARNDDALGQVLREANSLGETLRAQRLGAMEATALLRKVMAEIDVAIFTFDVDQKLRLVNRAGERLLGQPAERILGKTAAVLGLSECLEEELDYTLKMTFPGGSGKWGIRRGSFRERGLPHQLLVLSDLSRALREEESEAWRRLVRVLGHELNNSLTPIKSIAGSLESMMSLEAADEEWREDMKRGLAVIGNRAEALNRFMGAYARLARLPKPQLERVDVGACVRRVMRLETRVHIELVEGPKVFIRADGDQLDQVLINLLHNAADAALETAGGVSIGWAVAKNRLDVWVEDEGPGLSDTTNLFVPFFTTKPKGSGIGLVLSRQIAEAHGGTLTLENRRTGPGCEARLRLPL